MAYKPIISSKTKGYLYALLATVCFSNVYIFSKAALNEISLAKFWFYWFAASLLLNIVYSIFTKAFRALHGTSGKKYRVFFLLGFLEVLTEATFFIAIKTIPNPATTSFIGNMYMVFLIVLGVALLHERLTLKESIGAIITLIGTFMVGFNYRSSFTDMFIPGTGIVLLNTFIAAYTSVVAKKTVHVFNPALVNLNRSLFLFIASVIYFFLMKEDFTLSAKAAYNLFTGALLGPFLSILAIYFSFKHIEASKSSVVMGLKGVFVLIGTVFYFGIMPPKLQLAGGLISVVGVFIMTITRSVEKQSIIQTKT
jgi:drug/metabolite transporter (DMT)-like permease